MSNLGLSFLTSLDFSILPTQLVNGILLGSIYALIALGYTMVYGVLRLINFAHGEVYMLGAYAALFVSWGLGFQPGQSGASNALYLLIMMLASMVACALVGVTIERFAYRPMRSQPRIASLITAIGVSLLLQYGVALFVPSTPQTINEQVNPYRGAFTIWLVPKNSELKAAYDKAEISYRESLQAFNQRLPLEKSEFDLSPEGQRLRDAKFESENQLKQAQGAYDKSGMSITVPKGQLIMLVTSIVLMFLLRELVMKTKAGRAMRAVAHDFDSASLMGVNVNQIVTLTFIIGSSLAGAGAMMTATFLGTPITTFFGVLPGVKAFVAAVLGGIGNIPGAVLGGLLMGVAEYLAIWAGFSAYKDAIAFVILIAVLIFRPGGLLGSSAVEKV